MFKLNIDAVSSPNGFAIKANAIIIKIAPIVSLSKVSAVNTPANAYITNEMPAKIPIPNKKCFIFYTYNV